MFAAEETKEGSLLLIEAIVTKTPDKAEEGEICSNKSVFVNIRPRGAGFGLTHGTGEITSCRLSE